MPTIPTSPQLAELDDSELEELAREWRARAARGENEAFGIAHVLEVERRSRMRASQMITLHATLLPKPKARAWWKFWASSSRDEPMSPT